MFPVFGGVAACPIRHSRIQGTTQYLLIPDALVLSHKVLWDRSKMENHGIYSQKAWFQPFHFVLVNCDLGNS